MPVASARIGDDAPDETDRRAVPADFRNRLSDHEVAAHLWVVEIGADARKHDPAAVEDVDPVGQLAAEVEILLDEEDGDAGL